MIRQPPEYLGLISDQTWLADPYPAFRTFRERWPVARVDWPQRGVGDWMITRYPDFRRVLVSSDSSVQPITPDGGRIELDDLLTPDAAEGEPLASTMLTVDGPQHARLRGPLRAEFTHQRLDRLRPRLEKLADALLGGSSDTFDVIGDFAVPFTTTMVAELMGFTTETVESIRGYSEIIVERGFTFGRGFVSQDVRSAVSLLKQTLSAMITTKRRESGDDLISTTLTAFPNLDKWTEQQVLNTCVLMVLAGLQTTKHAIGNSVCSLVGHPDALEELREDQGLMRTAVEELLRFDGPSQAVGRFVTKDLELCGIVLSKGSFLRLILASANHDAREFDNPDVLDLRRHPNRHFAFGLGPHNCLGAQLGRLATNVALGSLLRRYRRLSSVPGGIIRELHSSLRGYRRLQVMGDR